MVKKSILAKVGDVIDYKLIRDGYKTNNGSLTVTEDMDVKTTVDVDTPSTVYTSNLDYEVDLSGQNPPIINVKSDITCPDDTVISKGKYLYYDVGQEYVVEDSDKTIEKISGIKDLQLKDDGNELTTKLFDYHYNTLQYNTKTVGSVTLDNGIASNFSNSNYLKVETSYTTDLTYVVKFTTGSNVSSNQYISMIDVWFDLYIDQNYLRCYNWSSGSIYNLTQVSTNTTYYVKITINSTDKTKTYEISNDGKTFTLLKTFTDSNIEIPSADLLIVGCHSTLFTSPFKGTIDLLNSYIETNGNKTYLAFYGDKANLYINNEKDNNLYYDKDEANINNNIEIIGSPTISNGIASNFSTSNYINIPRSKLTGNDTFIFKFKYDSLKGCLIHCEYYLALQYENSNLIAYNWGKRASETVISNIETNKWYWVKAEVTNTSERKYSVSTDGVNYEEVLTTTDSSASIQYSSYTTCLVGQSSYSISSSNTFNGSIDLLNSYYKIGDNEKQYFAENVTKRYNIPSLYSEFIDNITIPSHALYTYDNGEWKLSGDSPVITQDITVNADNAEITMKEIEE